MSFLMYPQNHTFNIIYSILKTDTLEESEHTVQLNLKFMRKYYWLVWIYYLKYVLCVWLLYHKGLFSENHQYLSYNK